MTLTVFECNANMYRTGEFADIPPSVCSLCGHNTLFTDFCGAMCHTCGRDIECSRNQIVNFQRSRAGLTIDQLSAATGFSALLITAYEAKELPVCDEYYEAFRGVIKAHYSKPRLVKSSAELDAYVAEVCKEVFGE